MKASRNREELEEGWTLEPGEHALLSSKRAGHARLGFAILMRFFAREGRFPAPAEIDEAAAVYVARQLGVNAADYRAYDHHSRTAEYHRAQIREIFGFRPATVKDAEERADWLLAEIAPREYDAERLKEAAYARFRALKVDSDTNTQKFRCSTCLLLPRRTPASAAVPPALVATNYVPNSADEPLNVRFRCAATDGPVSLESSLSFRPKVPLVLDRGYAGSWIRTSEKTPAC